MPVSRLPIHREPREVLAHGKVFDQPIQVSRLAHFRTAEAQLSKASQCPSLSATERRLRPTKAVSPRS